MTFKREWMTRSRRPSVTWSAGIARGTRVFFVGLLSSSESEMLHATVAPSGEEISQHRETGRKTQK